jgi:hypothetical protein
MPQAPAAQSAVQLALNVPYRLFGFPSTYEGSPYQPNADMGETLTASITSIPVTDGGPVAVQQPGAPTPSYALSWTTKYFGGNPSAVSVSLQGSNNASSWTIIDTSTNVAGETRTLTAQAYKFFRAIVNSKTGGSTFAVYLTLTSNAGG